MTVLSTGSQLLKSPQYVEEATYGTLPTASPTLLWIGDVTDIKPTVDIGLQSIRKVGSEDVYQHVLGARQTRLDLEFGLQSSTFIKYAINAQGGGTGSIDKSLSMLYSVAMGGQGGTENFFVLTGVRPDTLKLAIKPKQIHKATMTMFAQANSGPEASSGITTPTYATDPATAPWNFADMGTTPVTLAGTNLDITELNLQFARNLEEVYTLQQVTPMFLPPKNREITGDLTVAWENATYYTDLQALTEGSLVVTLKNGTSVLTLSNTALKKLESLEVAPGEVIYEKYSLDAKTASVT